MKKEVFLAIITGLVVGSIISFAIYQARNYYLGDQNGPDIRVETPTNDISEPENQHSIEILSPLDFSLSDTNRVSISGTTSPNSYMSAVSEISESIFLADSNGNFSLDFVLAEGVNIITLTAITYENEEANQAEVDLTVTYLTESETEVADEED